MSFSYQVILRPTDVKFTEIEIANKFDNGVKLKDLEKDVFAGKILIKNIPIIQVVWFPEKWEWYALNNRRLYVFQELERAGKLSYVAMSRVELLDTEYVFPKVLYKEVKLYEPDWDIRATNNNLTVSSDSTSSLNNIAHLAKTEVCKKFNQVELTEKVSSLVITGENNGSGDVDVSVRLVLDEDDEVSEEEMIKDMIIIDEIDLSEENKNDENVKVDQNKEMEIDDGNIDIKVAEAILSPPDNKIDRIKSKKLKSLVVKQSEDLCLESLSNFSLGSVSSINVKERLISTTSGLSGYGYYHVYKTEYLDKIKNARTKALKRLKPYDVDKKRSRLPSLMSSRCSSFSNVSSDTMNKKSQEWYSRSDADKCSNFSLPDLSSRPSSPTPERRLNKMRFDRFENSDVDSRIRLYSDDLGYSSNEHGRDTDSERSWKHDRRQVDYQRHKSPVGRRRRFSSSSDKEIVPYKPAKDRPQSCYSLETYDYHKTVKSGVCFAALYATWEKRRSKFLKQSEYAIADASLPSYICGICFKRFSHVVDIQQHCEALLHYACITCGKFFSAYASLGQHCRQFKHKKD